MEPKEVRKLWVDTLRNGRYEQGQCGLCCNNKYCCLGVLCELYQLHVGDLEITEYESYRGTQLKYDGNTSYLPEKVREWAGLRSMRGYISDTSQRSLAHLNDDADKTFKEIADIIESEPEGLLYEIINN